jgi:hypothetical protein
MKEFSNAWILEHLRKGRRYRVIADLAECTQACIFNRAKMMREECGVTTNFQMLERYVAGKYVPSEGRKSKQPKPSILEAPTVVERPPTAMLTKPAVFEQSATPIPAKPAVVAATHQVALSDLDCYPCKQRGHRCTAGKVIDGEPWCKACAEGRVCEMVNVGRMQQRSVDLARYA